MNVFLVEEVGFRIENLVDIVFFMLSYTTFYINEKGKDSWECVAVTWALEN